MDPRPGTVTCDICQRSHHPQKLPFYCAIDARNALYENRIANARVLMEMDQLEQQIDALLHDGSLPTTPSAPTSISSRPSRTHIEACTSEEYKSRERTEQIIAAAEKLQKEMDEAKREMAQRKATNVRRKTDLASISQGIDARRNRELEETKTAIKIVRYTWNQGYAAMSLYRAALCTEVAKLYRLQRVRRGNPVRFEYKIGGIEVVDLHHLNSTNHEHISASLGHIAHLLWLASHYLAVRLPAEITLPHKDYPRPTIFSLGSSYHHGQVPFPGTSPIPVDGRDRLNSSMPHPRPLFLDKPLSTFSKDESTNYTAFLEAVCLLAYNIVWLCRTQGISTGTDSGNNGGFEEFAYIGRNLYNLLIGHRNQPGQPLISDADVASTSQNGSTANGSETTTDLTKAAPKMGVYAHGTSHTSLNSAAGQELTRSFKLPNPIKLADKLKARLLNEAPVPEWELIEGNEFAASNDLDDGVLVGGSPQSKSMAARFGLESYMSVNTVRSTVTAESRTAGGRASTSVKDNKEKEREKSSSGWTKIRSR
ncbi:UV radiation resistance protein and autophagy-related subunit 14-domain-containing protein [Xylariales sp. PMI_506]|nr:UV radiation resistance protein and autophagy-related subunit 14-domain-containing protein [Xylariales sp. PMI_506]